MLRACRIRHLPLVALWTHPLPQQLRLLHVADVVGVAFFRRRVSLSLEGLFITLLPLKKRFHTNFKLCPRIRGYCFERI